MCCKKAISKRKKKVVTDIGADSWTYSTTKKCYNGFLCAAERAYLSVTRIMLTTIARSFLELRRGACSPRNYLVLICRPVHDIVANYL